MPLQEVRAQIFLLRHLNRDGILRVWILSDFKLHLITNSLWIELVTFWSTIFNRFASRNDHGHIIFDDHLPEMVDSFWKRTLTGNDFLVSHSFFSFVWRVNVTRINVVIDLILTFSHSLLEMDSRFVIREDISITIPVAINLVRDELLKNKILLIHLLKRIILIRHIPVINLFQPHDIRNFVGLHQLWVLGDHLVCHIEVSLVLLPEFTID